MVLRGCLCNHATKTALLLIFMSVCEQTIWGLLLVWPLTQPLRSEVWEHACYILSVLLYGNSPLEGVAVCVESWNAQRWRGAWWRDVYVCVYGCTEGSVGGGSLFLFLVARETPSACVRCCTCWTIALLLSIQSERPRWRFPPSANKSPGHPVCLSPPSFPSTPLSLTSPHFWPSWENWGLLPSFLPSPLLPGHPHPTSYLSCAWSSTFIYLCKGLFPFLTCNCASPKKILMFDVTACPSEEQWSLNLTSEPGMQLHSL